MTPELPSVSQPTSLEVWSKVADQFDLEKCLMPPYVIERKIRDKAQACIDNEWPNTGRSMAMWLGALRDQPGLSPDDILGLDQVAQRVDDYLRRGCYIAVWTGGFDLGSHHLCDIGILDIQAPPNARILLGVEADEYIDRKNRPHIFPWNLRLAAMATVLKQHQRLAGAFLIPPRPEVTNEESWYYQLDIDIGVIRTNCCPVCSSPAVDPHAARKALRIGWLPNWAVLPVVIGEIPDKPRSTSSTIAQDLKLVRPRSKSK